MILGSWSFFLKFEVEVLQDEKPDKTEIFCPADKPYIELVSIWLTI